MFQIEKIAAYVKKHFTARDCWFVGLVFFFFFATRLFRLDQFPIFSDEGIYIRWAKVAWHDSSWRFISLTDGRQPLQTWATIPFLKLFPDNALFAGRLFATASGFAALTGFMAFTYYLWGKRGAYIGTLLYLLTPYYLFYERLALVDAAVNAAFIWILFLSIVLARTRRFDVALILGLIAGMGLLAKSSVQLFLIMAALTPILFFPNKKFSLLLSKKDAKKFILEGINYYILFAVASALAYALYNIQRLSPFFHYIGSKNTTFILTFAEFLQNPTLLIGSNIRIIPTYLLSEMGVVVGLLGIIGLIIMLKKEWRLGLFFLATLLLPYAAVGFFSRVLFPRYLIFMSTALVLCATYALIHLPQAKKKILWVFIIFIGAASYYLILFNPARLPMPEIDRGQYIEGNTAVWGAQEVLALARETAKTKKVILLAEGNFGLVADVLDTFTKPSDTNIFVAGVWPLNEEHIYEYQKKENKDTKVYIVFSHRSEFPAHWPISLVIQFDKPGGKAALYVFEYLSRK